MKAQKVSFEVAEAEYQRVVDALDLERDPASETKEETARIEETKAAICRAICDGTFEVDDKGRIVAFLGGETITFNHPTGSTFMAIDKRTGDIARGVAVLQDISRKSDGFFAKLPMREFKLCLKVVALFLG